MDNQNNVPPPLPPDGDDVQRVDAEPMEEERYRFGKKASGGTTGFGGAAGGGDGARVFSFGVNARADDRKPPVIATWIFLAAAWLFLGSKAPFTVFVGVPLDIVALLLGTICLSRGAVTTGAFALFLGTVGAFVVYLIGLFRFLLVGL